MAEQSVEKIYQKKTQIEHVLLRPDTYIGSVEYEYQEMWVLDAKNERFVEKKIKFVPGLYKIFDEIIVNAADNYQRDKKMTSIKVNIDQQSNRISVMNNGKGIPVDMHKEHQVYIPELVFGHLLTSSNYNDSIKKVTGGRNGYGAKLTNIFSKKFVIEIADSKKGKLYKQEFKNNLSQICDPNISEYSRDKFDYTLVTFEPDLKKFQMKTLDDDTVSLLSKRVYDLAGCTPPGVSIFLNDKKITKVKDFETYVEMYTTKDQFANRIFERCSDRWQVCVIPTEIDQFQQVSFVNSICTVKGGSHVNHVTDQICDQLRDAIQKKNKKIDVKPFQIKQSLWIFVLSLIENPSFDSQTKETLTTKSTAFGSTCELSDKFFKQVQKSKIIDTILSNAEAKEAAKLKRGLGTGGPKKQKLFGIPKLEDANDAGGKNSEQCTLILTEGDSAKSLAMSGIQVVGRDKFGVFPLRGKLLNVRDCSMAQIIGNEEVQNIIKIMGLYMDREYDDLKSLRYGRIMIMADQDHDGSHIKGLLINFIHHFWPSLIKKNPGFLVQFITPIIKAQKGQESISFYSIPEYEKWEQNTQDYKSYKIKYYKGLGTSTAAEAKEYFKQIVKHRIEFQYQDQEDDRAIELAFSKNFADKRKQWLSQFDNKCHNDHNAKKLKYSDFVHKELIHFSNADNMRSIPSIMDGLKPGQRKILFACFKRKLKQEIKVAQLAGYVAEHSAYHHGEISLCMTIVNMAQNFVGSNNINLLMPNGQFGTRMMGGKESASPRYIYTCLSKLTRIIFNENDDDLLKWQVEEGQNIEPEYYYPTIPMVLVNGAEGIGTGWSTSIPCYNPLDIIKNIRKKLHNPNFTFERMFPWYRGYIGQIVQDMNGQDNQLKSQGCFRKKNEETLEITELPIKKWARDYKGFIEEMILNKKVDDIKEFHKDDQIHFVLTVPGLDEMSDSEIDKTFRLSSNLNCNNFVLFDSNLRIRKYANEIEILEEFYQNRYQLYVQRKAHLIKLLNQKYEKSLNQYKFIDAILKNEIQIFGQKIEKIVQTLKSKGFKTYAQIYGNANQNKQNQNQKKDKEFEENYDYLMKMNIYTFTEKQMQKLQEKMKEREKALVELEQTSIEELWLKDLEELEKAYIEDEKQQGREALLHTKYLTKFQDKAKTDVEMKDSYNDYKSNTNLLKQNNEVGYKQPQDKGKQNNNESSNLSKDKKNQHLQNSKKQQKEETKDSITPKKRKAFQIESELESEDDSSSSSFSDEDEQYNTKNTNKNSKINQKKKIKNDKEEDKQENSKKQSSLNKRTMRTTSSNGKQSQNKSNANQKQDHNTNKIRKQQNQSLKSKNKQSSEDEDDEDDKYLSDDSGSEVIKKHSSRTRGNQDTKKVQNQENSNPKQKNEKTSTKKREIKSEEKQNIKESKNLKDVLANIDANDQNQDDEPMPFQKQDVNNFLKAENIPINKTQAQIPETKDKQSTQQKPKGTLDQFFQRKGSQVQNEEKKEQEEQEDDQPIKRPRKRFIGDEDDE